MRPQALLAAAAASLLACTAASTTSTDAAPSAGTSSQSGAAHPASAARAGKPANWAFYHYSKYRSGNYPSMPTPTKLTVSHRVRLDGAVYASPLVISGRTIVATENNTVYAFDSRFRVVWKKHLGAPSPANQRPCGNIDPLGITGTPVYDANTNRIYVAAERSGSSPTHRLYALSFRTGGVAWSRSLDFPGVDRRVMQERGALTIVGSRVYVPFGGLAGDCGQYKGRIVSYTTSGRSPIRWTVPTNRMAGIWTPPGLTADNSGHILAAVGNGNFGNQKYDYSDSVLEFSTSLKLTDHFSPSNWRAENANDADLGSQGATMVGQWVFIDGKGGNAYVLRRNHFGGVGGQVSKRALCTSFGGTAVRPATVYVPCTDGVRAVRIDSSGRMHVLWHAASNINGSPVIGGGHLFALDPNAGRLYELSLTNGRVVRSVSVGAVNRFATPALYGRNLRVGTLTGVVDVRTS